MFYAMGAQDKQPIGPRSTATTPHLLDLYLLIP